jgi:glucose/arabinose dehydrogenase
MVASGSVREGDFPDYSLSSPFAALGLAFCTADSLPQKYRGGAFVGEHGSCDRPRFNGYRSFLCRSAADGRSGWPSASPVPC